MQFCGPLLIQMWLCVSSLSVHWDLLHWPQITASSVLVRCCSALVHCKFWARSYGVLWPTVPPLIQFQLRGSSLPVHWDLVHWPQITVSSKLVLSYCVSVHCNIWARSYAVLWPTTNSDVVLCEFIASAQGYVALTTDYAKHTNLS